jgi:CBS domain-containing protein
MAKVSAIMTRNPACCTPEASLQEAARMMVDCDCGGIPVVESLSSLIPLGVITDRDIACRAVAEGHNPLQMHVIDCMTSPAVTCTAEMDIHDCLRTMEANQVRRVPVVDERGRLCGIVSQADIAESLSLEETGEMVREVSLPPASPMTTH